MSNGYILVVALIHGRDTTVADQRIASTQIAATFTIGLLFGLTTINCLQKSPIIGT
jgi:hypothetical protein